MPRRMGKRNDATGDVTGWLLDAQHQLTARDFLFA